MPNSWSPPAESSAAESSAACSYSAQHSNRQYTQLFPSVMLPADGQEKTLGLDLSDVHKMKLIIQCSNVSEAGRHRSSCSTCKGMSITFTITPGTFVPVIGHSCSCNLTYSVGLLCAGVPSYGLYIVPPTDSRVARFIQSFAFVSVHERTPYVRFCTKYPIACKVGEGLGHSEFFDCVRTAYPEGYMGAFTPAIWWQSRQPLATSSGA